LGATVVLWVLFAFTTFLDIASALPLQVFDGRFPRRADNSPGLGVELEAGRIVIKGKADLTPAQREQIKGAQMIPIGFAGGPMTDWELTAELG
jgi:hypothetical protein